LAVPDLQNLQGQDDHSYPFHRHVDFSQVKQQMYNIDQPLPGYFRRNAKLLT